ELFADGTPNRFCLLMPVANPPRVLGLDCFPFGPQRLDLCGLCHIGVVVYSADFAPDLVRDLSHPRIERAVVVAFDLHYEYSTQGSGLQCFQCVKFGRALAIAFLEADPAPLAFLDRSARQAQLTALIGGERDRANLDVEVEVSEPQ